MDKDKGGSSITNVFDLACQKLCGRRTISPHDDHHMLAILGQRFALDVARGHLESVKHVEEGISNHLRVCLSTTEDRMWLHSMYPSEPLLSSAAAFVLHKDPKALENCLNTLRKKIYGGMIEIGHGGELASLILLLLAKDCLVHQHLPHHRSLFVKSPSALSDPWDAELIDCQKVPLLQYLDHLFGTQKRENKARAAFERAYVNFSHWVTMETPIATRDRLQPGYGLIAYRDMKF